MTNLAASLNERTEGLAAAVAHAQLRALHKGKMSIAVIQKVLAFHYDNCGIVHGDRRQRNSRTQCSNNLRNPWLANLNYESAQ